MTRRLNARRAAAALALAFGAALAGCGGGGPAAGSGATLVVARVKDAVGLDPSHETDGISLNLANEIYETLVAFKPGTFDVVPQLAASWTASLGREDLDVQNSRRATGSRTARPSTRPP